MSVHHKWNGSLVDNAAGFTVVPESLRFALKGFPLVAGLSTNI